MNYRRPVLLLAAIAALCGCVDMPQRAGSSSMVQFGVVRNAQEITLDSQAASGALVGGTLGLMMTSPRQSSHRSVRNAILGAGAGAAVTGMAEGNRRGMSYSVEMVDGSVVRIVTDQREIRTGDCVAIERVRDTANIRRVAQNYCDRANNRAVESVADHSRAEATACEAAKAELVDASTQEAIDLASQKVSLLCDS